MSRKISQDADLLIEYLREFDLNDCLKEDNYIILLKSMHRKAYGYLLFIAELEVLQRNVKIISDLSLIYYKETTSDIIQSLFCWATGSYKAANIMLRSSIETFLKATLGTENEEIYDEKSIYKLFEKASEHEFFSSSVGLNKYGIIHGIYKDLCKFAHSARDINLGTITSINLLPRFNQKLAKEYNVVFLKLLDSILSVTLLNFETVVNQMHSLNKDLFLSTLTLNDKKEIFENQYVDT
ncbi:hypothetical protein [Paenibacillus ihumii]|uniref:hypothetical protein n=1 Tax=Paenibacillus ihumii TaxID=687436 RepID=UPI0006D8089C|nr:hypothetical protein [Paenibacillus ihumii]